jgi:signal transduction histidine kinase/ligand-binding sensor domain-containing protein
MCDARKRRLTVGILLCLCFLGLFAQSRPAWALDPTRAISQYAHNSWTIQDGYLGGKVNAITQSGEGYLWVGTTAGLLRFDGIRFTAWDPPGEPKTLSTAEINALLTAQDGSIWIAARKTQTTQKLSHWSGRQLTNILVESAGIFSIHQDNGGSVWISAPFCRIVDMTLQCHARADGAPFDRVEIVASDAAGNIWIGTDVDLVRWNAGAMINYAPSGLKSNRGMLGVDAIAPANDGSLWAGMNKRGRDMGLQHLVHSQWKAWVTAGFDSSNLTVVSLLMDRQGALWIGTADQGIYRIYHDKLEHFQSTDGLSSDYVVKLYEDREGNIWAATAKGIDRFRDRQVITYSAAEGLCTSEVDSALVARDGTLWIGGDEALIALREDRVSCITSGKGLPGNQVTSLFEDHDHRLWVGIDNSLWIYEKGVFTPINKRDGTGVGLVIDIAEDTDHNIWVVTTGQRRELIRIAHQIVQDELQAPQIPAPHKVAADPQGGIWVGFMNGDLGRYQFGRMDIVHFDPARTAMLHQLTMNPDGSVWGATDLGLIGWENGKRLSLTSRNGLPCDVVTAFITDGAGTLWLYMRCGLVAIANAELQKWRNDTDAALKIRVFDTLDGMQPGVAPFQGSARTADGRLWFPNGSLLQMIDPSRLGHEQPAPFVHIEDVIADQKRYGAGEAVNLPPASHNIEIDYTAPFFAIPQRIRFRYKLEGQDSEWQEPGTRRQAFYSDLRPGRYTFHVIASNEGGEWSDVGASLNFDVAPAWYQTNWFRLACLFVGLVIIWTAYRIRVSQVARQLSARFDERLSERTRIARDLHDTLLQTIQGSKLVVDDALEQPADLTRLRGVVEQLSGWLQRAIQEGRTALNSLREPVIQSNDLAQALKQATEERQIQDPRMEVRFSVAGTPVELHPLVRYEIYQIGDEAIRNAWSHSKGSQLNIELTYAKDLILRVSDNGVGIESVVVSQGKEGHFGLQGMRERVARIGGNLTINSSPRAGSEITVVVPGKVAFRKQRNRLLESLKSITRGDGSTLD